MRPGRRSQRPRRRRRAEASRARAARCRRLAAPGAARQEVGSRRAGRRAARPDGRAGAGEWRVAPGVPTGRLTGASASPGGFSAAPERGRRVPSAVERSGRGIEPCPLATPGSAATEPVPPAVERFSRARGRPRHAASARSAPARPRPARPRPARRRQPRSRRRRRARPGRRRRPQPGRGQHVGSGSRRRPAPARQGRLQPAPARALRRAPAREPSRAPAPAAGSPDRRTRLIPPRRERRDGRAARG